MIAHATTANCHLPQNVVYHAVVFDNVADTGAVLLVWFSSCAPVYGFLAHDIPKLPAICDKSGFNPQSVVSTCTYPIVNIGAIDGATHAFRTLA